MTSASIVGAPVRISIVMPSFNQADYLAEAIDSVLDQQYPDLELIVIDGGSTDESQSILRHYASRLTFWQSAPDRGQSDALRQGFGLATGELLGWLNSDDVLLPGALIRTALHYRDKPGSGLLAGNIVLIDYRGRVLRCKRYPSRAGYLLRTVGLLGISQPGSFFTRDAYDAVGGLNPDLRYVMDTDLYIRMLETGVHYLHINNWQAGFRSHSRSKTIGESAEARREYRFAMRHHWPKSIPDPPWEPVRPWLWRLVQTVNGNYARMSLETIAAGHAHWRLWAARNRLLRKAL